MYKMTTISVLTIILVISLITKIIDYRINKNKYKKTKKTKEKKEEKLFEKLTGTEYDHNNFEDKISKLTDKEREELQKFINNKTNQK